MLLILPLSTVHVNFRARAGIRFSEKKVESLFILAFFRTTRDRMKVCIIGNKCLTVGFSIQIGHFGLKKKIRLRFRVAL